MVARVPVYTDDSLNLTLQTVLSKCQFWNPDNETWEGDGCHVSVKFVEFPFNNRYLNIAGIHTSGQASSAVSRPARQLISTKYICYVNYGYTIGIRLFQKKSVPPITPTDRELLLCKYSS